MKGLDHAKQEHIGKEFKSSYFKGIHYFIVF